MNWVVSLVARVAVFGIYLGVAVVSHVASGMRRIISGTRHSRKINKRSLILLGTFYNLGWFRSHILPLTKTTALDEIIVISDKPLMEVAKVVYCKPPKWLTILGRTPSRFLWALREARRRRCGIWMGYHVMPNALFALVGARLTGANAVYQMTGGPIQLLGGGHGSENVLLRKLQRPSKLLESLLYHVIRQFDCVIVRGGSARQFVEQNRLCDRCEVITGSVDVSRFCPSKDPAAYDIAYVSRLVPCKGLETFLSIVAATVQIRPSLRVAIVGGGPLRDALQKQAEDLKIDHCVSFLGQVDRVEDVLQQSKLFMLVSPSEGLSIAMIEAMASGLPAIVTDVGDLRDMVETDQTGVLLDSIEPEAVALRIEKILADDPLRATMSQASRQMAVARCSIDAVAQRWNVILSADNRVGNEGENDIAAECGRGHDRREISRAS